MRRCFLSLGSNIEPRRHLVAAIALLRQHGLVAVSRVYETMPVGPRDQAAYLNAAVVIMTDRPAAAIKQEVCDAIEHALGRRRDPADRFAPRTIDLDVVLCATEDGVVSDPAPDPDILRHGHVARPLADLAPDLVLPADGRTLGQIADDLDAAVPADRRPRPRTDLQIGLDGDGETHSH